MRVFQQRKTCGKGEDLIHWKKEKGRRGMRNIWHDINPRYISPGRFTAVIEIPAGSKKKYELDKETGLLRLDRIL